MLAADATGWDDRPAIEADSQPLPVDQAMAPRSWIQPALAALALTASALWLSVMLWLCWPAVSTLDAPALAELIAALCVPPLLIGVIWLVARGGSRGEAKRFAQTAAAMRAEAATLEDRIVGLTDRLAAGRAALADQAAALMALGDAAASRLGAVNETAAGQIDRAEEQGRRLAEAADNADAALARLLERVPTAQASTEAMAGALDAAGAAAVAKAEALTVAVDAIVEHGRIAGDTTGAAADRLQASIAAVDAASREAGERLDAVASQLATEADDLLTRTASTIDETRKGLTTQNEAMLAMLDAHQTAIDRAARETSEALAQRIDAIDAAVSRIAASLTAQADKAAALNATVRDEGLAQTEQLSESIERLALKAQTLGTSLQTGAENARQVIGTAEDLLTAVDAAVREIDETLPEALARLDTRIGASHKLIGATRPDLLTLVTAAEGAHDAITAFAQLVVRQRAALDQLTSVLLRTLGSGQEHARTLSQLIADTQARADDFASQSAPRLLDALLRVRETATSAADHARETITTVIPDAAHSLEIATAQAMQRAMGASLERQVSDIARVADEAANVAARAADRVSRQMTLIAGATAAVSERIEAERAERERHESDSFARRAAALIDSLNSAAIDVAQALSADVADPAWAAYLKGDHGAFTRHAVRLLGEGTAHDVHRLYESDAAFREQVNRYIHDFETMLRSVLAQRDGSTLAVTLLSSDMGKLYVALAQAIERLRG